MRVAFDLLAKRHFLRPAPPKLLRLIRHISKMATLCGGPILHAERTLSAKRNAVARSLAIKPGTLTVWDP